MRPARASRKEVSRSGPLSLTAKANSLAKDITGGSSKATLRSHGETDAFRNAGRRRNYRDTIMVTTLAPCWYCNGLVRQFGIGTVIVGETVNFRGGENWLAENGVNVIDLNEPECIQMLSDYIANNPDIWYEDIGK